jgi:hypothetical protein
VREQGSAECIDVRARRGVGHAYDVHPVRFQQCVKIEIAGVVDQHRVARLQQKTANQVDGVGAGLGEHDLFKRGFDPDACRRRDKNCLSGGCPSGEAYSVSFDVSERATVRSALRMPAEHPGGGSQPPRFQRIAGGFQRLARDPQRVDFTIKPWAKFGECQWRHRPGYVKAGARAS